MLMGPFDAARDGSNAPEVRLVAKLPKDALVEIRRHVEEPRLAVFESDVELVTRTCLDMRSWVCCCC
jgi:hypothetical protein